jgi:hypothetical protein
MVLEALPVVVVAVVVTTAVVAVATTKVVAVDLRISEVLIMVLLQQVFEMVMVKLSLLGLVQGVFHHLYL